MHELGIVFHIIRTVEDVAKENHVARIQRVTLQLGEVSGVVESYLQDCWKWAAAKSEILPGAAVTGEQIPAITLCEDCGQQYPHRAPWPHLPPLPKPPYPPAAGQRDYDQRSGSRGAGDPKLPAEKNSPHRLRYVNSTPFVRQYDILFNKWGVLLCQKEYQTNDIRRNSREWL